MIPEKLQTRILIVLIAIGAFLRFYQVGFQCYWTEEQYTLTMAKLSFGEILNASIITDCNPPLYYLSAHAVMIVSGFADLSIRYPSVICGILLIPAMFALGYVYKNQMTGLYCAGFTTILYPLVYYSQFGRAYSMSFLFFVIALIFYIRIKDGDHSYGTKALFGILAALNIWTHLFALIPIGLMILDLIISNGRKMAKSVILTGMLCSPLIWMPLSFIKSRITMAPATGTSQGFGMTLPQILITTPFEFFSTAFPYFGILSIIGMNDLWNDKEEIGLKLVIIAFATMIIGIICSLFTPFFPRYFLTVSFIFILISAVACANFTELIESDKNKILVFFILLGFLLAFQNGDYIAHYFTQKYVC
jgi:mannosyltransferase